MKCYNITESIKTWRKNKDIKEFINSLENSGENDLQNAEKVLEGFPSSGNFKAQEILELREQLELFIKEEKIRNPLKSNPLSILPNDFKLSI